MITLEQYAMGRDEKFHEEWIVARPNAIVLLDKVNAFLEMAFPNINFQVSSGFRPKQINSTIPGSAKLSLHTIGKAIDLKDADGFFKKTFRPLENKSDAEMLRKFGLFMEDPLATKTWVHLDMGNRLDRPSRVFKI